MLKTYVIGHKNPDTDSVVSAIVFANLEPENNKNYIAAVSGKINKETEYILKRFGFEVPVQIPSEEKKVILVDHNEPSQMSEAVKAEEIIGVFDHHKLGGLITQEPIMAKIKPVGSTATLGYFSLKEKGIEPEKNLAGLMLSAIISDTLKFTSPTTTEEDKRAATELLAIAGVDIEELASAMFAAKSDISDISTDELLKKDYKVFEMAGKKVGIGVWETTLPQTVLERKDEILAELAAIKKSDELDLIFFGVVDIVNSQTDLVVVESAEEEVVTRAFGTKIQDSVATLPDVVSRKKQIAPFIERALA